MPRTLSRHAAHGALLGSAVGDALGAPFEFGAPGDFSRRFPEPLLGPETEMCGGGVWAPGEFTDDTGMALALGESLVANGGVDGADLFERFRAWKKTAKDVGSQTRSVLDGTLGWEDSAADHFRRTGRAAGNGSLMRATTSAIFFAARPRAESLEAACTQSAVTHGDPAAGWGAAIYHGMLGSALCGRDPFADLDRILSLVPDEHRDLYGHMLSPDWARKPGDRGNGSVWGCLADAVAAVRHTDTFEDAMRRALDVGDDVDTVACVAGGLAGAVHGVQAIPSRWISAVHGTISTPDGEKTWRNRDLQDLVRQLLDSSEPPQHPDEPAEGPEEIEDGVYAANILGATRAPTDRAVLSLCRVDDHFAEHTHRREVFLIDAYDADANPGLTHVVDDVVDEIDAFRAAGIPVVVHCHGGRSRTALVLRAWLMRRHGISDDKAFERIVRRWPIAHRNNPVFREFLAP